MIYKNIVNGPQISKDPSDCKEIRKGSKKCMRKLKEMYEEAQRNV